MSWKSAVYDYVQAKNRAEAEQDVAPLRAILTGDDAALREQAQVLAAAGRGNALRGIRPLEQETRLRVQPVRESPSEAMADLELRRTISYELRGQRHMEQRTERERVLLAHIGENRWTIVKVQRLQPPDGRIPPVPGAMRHYAAGRPEPALSSLSTPYLTTSESIYSAYTGTDSAAGNALVQGRRNSLPLDTSILNPGESSSRKIYNREAAVQYAETWWNGVNPRYIEFEVDCTNFVSQCLFAGGLPMHYTGKRDSGWWFRGRVHGQELWSYSWAVAHSLLRYLLSSGRAQQVSSPLELRAGDTICYDWDGDGRYQHNTIVTGMDASGAPLVNAHTYNARNRYWAYHDSPAWSERTTYVFLRVADQI